MKTPRTTVRPDVYMYKPRNSHVVDGWWHCVAHSGPALVKVRPPVVPGWRTLLRTVCVCASDAGEPTSFPQTGQNQLRNCPDR